MKTTSTSGKGRARRARSLTATLGVMATIAALSIPVALPASAGAMATTGFCGMAIRNTEAAKNRGDLHAAAYWANIAINAGCL